MTLNDEGLRVLIVADDPLVRSALGRVVSEGTGNRVVGRIPGGVDLQEALERYRADLILWDLGWEPSLEIAPLPGAENASLPLLVLLPDDGYAADLWSIGARGLLPRDADAASIAAALHGVSQGLAVIHPSLAPAITAVRDASTLRLDEMLTPRELEVIGLLAEGLPNRTISQRLGISEHTVKFHVNAILGKLGAHSRTEAVTRAARSGLISL
jgi:DNA-binding NarL/FixJ family response regulator